MKRPTTIVALVSAFTVALLTISGSAEARSRPHWHHYTDYALYYDYSYGSWQSPCTYIYPAANWGPLFHRVRPSGLVERP